MFLCQTRSLQYPERNWDRVDSFLLVRDNSSSLISGCQSSSVWFLVLRVMALLTASVCSKRYRLHEFALLHKLYQHFLVPIYGGPIRFFDMPAVGPTDSWLCSSQKQGLLLQARPHTHKLQSPPYAQQKHTYHIYSTVPNAIQTSRSWICGCGRLMAV